MPLSVKTEAFVLKKKVLLRRDSLVTFFTEELGKITSLAPGMRSIKSRRLPHTQTGNLVTVLLRADKERYFLGESTLISGFSEIKKNAKKLSILYFLLYIIDRLLPDGQREEKVYVLLKKTLIRLSRTDFTKSEVEKSLNALLIHLGYIKEDVSLREQKVIIEELTHEKLPLFII